MVLISLKDDAKILQRLARKISGGCTLDEAALQLGVPLEEVLSYVSGKMAEVDMLDFQLRLMGQRAIKKSLTKLSKLASGDQRLSGRMSISGDGKERESESLVSDDLEAAKALAKFGIDALKLARSGSKKDAASTEQKDLFDAAQDPWKLRRVE